MSCDTTFVTFLEVQRKHILLSTLKIRLNNVTVVFSRPIFDAANSVKLCCLELGKNNLSSESRRAYSVVNWEVYEFDTEKNNGKKIKISLWNDLCGHQFTYSCQVLWKSYRTRSDQKLSSQNKLCLSPGTEERFRWKFYMVTHFPLPVPVSSFVQIHPGSGNMPVVKGGGGGTGVPCPPSACCAPC